MPVLSLSEVDIPADRIGIPSMRNPPPARVLPDESRFLAVEIIAVVAHTAPPGKLPSAANQVERFRWQHTPAPRTALLCWQHPFPKPPPRHPSAHGQAIPLEAVSSLFPVVRDVQPVHVIRPRSGNPDNQPIASVPSVKGLTEHDRLAVCAKHLPLRHSLLSPAFALVGSIKAFECPSLPSLRVLHAPLI